jgi:exonuclease SbcD
MKIFHLSDLHLGKRVYEFSMLEDQEYILKVILGYADVEKPDAALISGDVFDRLVAPTEALRVFDDFLDGLRRHGVEVFIISGNHDSADRLAFGSRLMDASGVHFSRVFDGHLEPYTLGDTYGLVQFYLLPFLKPAQVKACFPEAAITTWTDALATVIDSLKIDSTQRNVLLAHQFVTGALTCESEELNVGGADNVDAAVFDPFDYVALGHLHGPQHVIRDTLRYCGTPLKYSFSEVKHAKSLTVVELGAKELGARGEVLVRTLPLHPRRDLVELEGAYLDITERSYYEERKLDRDAYYHITLTDEEDQLYAMGRLRSIYPQLMRLDYNNRRTQAQDTVSGAVDVEHLSPLELFEQLYETQNGQPLSEAQREYTQQLIEEVWGEQR